jgi:hypothetical protein
MSKLYLNSGKATAKIEHKTRGRMKILLKFNQEEAQALKNWTNQVKPPQIDEDTFYKQVFFNGIGALNQQLTEMAKSSLKDENVRNQLREAGVDVEKLEKELNNSMPNQPQPPSASDIFEVSDPAAPVEVLPDGEVSPKETNTTQDATDTK